jgi:uncharacterized membrane protein
MWRDARRGKPLANRLAAGHVRAMDKRDVSSARLDFFSDGVMAIALTVMLVELKAPESASPAALLALWPDFLSYFISFGFIAIFWVNHHYVTHRIGRLTEPVVWTNTALLFEITLIPFCTAYLARSHLAPFATGLYAAVLGASSFTFGALRSLVAKGIDDPAEREVFFGRKVLLVGGGATVVVLASVAVAAVSPPVTLAMIVVGATLVSLPITRR